MTCPICNHDLQYQDDRDSDGCPVCGWWQPVARPVAHESLDTRWLRDELTAILELTIHAGCPECRELYEFTREWAEETDELASTIVDKPFLSYNTKNSKRG